MKHYSLVVLGRRATLEAETCVEHSNLRVGEFFELEMSGNATNLAGHAPTKPIMMDTATMVVVAAASSLNEGLVQTLQAASSTSDRSRRVCCSRILNQWKKEILPKAKEIGLELLRVNTTTNDFMFINDGGIDCDCIVNNRSNDDCGNGTQHSIVQLLLYIINNDSRMRHQLKLNVKFKSVTRLLTDSEYT